MRGRQKRGEIYLLIAFAASAIAAKFICRVLVGQKCELPYQDRKPFFASFFFLPIINCTAGQNSLEHIETEKKVFFVCMSTSFFPPPFLNKT